MLKLKQKKLKAICKERAIKVGGTKAELAERLYEDGYRHGVNQKNGSELRVESRVMESNAELSDDDNVMDNDINGRDPNHNYHDENHNNIIRYGKMDDNQSKKRWIKGQKTILKERINGSLKQMDGAGILVLVDLNKNLSESGIAVRTAWCGRFAGTMDENNQIVKDFQKATLTLISHWKKEDDERRGTSLKEKAALCEQLEDGLKDLAANKNNLSKTEYNARCAELVQRQMLLLNNTSQDVNIEMSLDNGLDDADSKQEDDDSSEDETEDEDY